MLWVPSTLQEIVLRVEYVIRFYIVLHQTGNSDYKIERKLTFNCTSQVCFNPGKKSTVQGSVNRKGKLVYFTVKEKKKKKKKIERKLIVYKGPVSH